MPSDRARDDHGDDHKMIKCSTWKRRKRKKPLKIKAKVLLRVLVLVIKTP